MHQDAWPTLAYDDWRETCATLHMYTQVVGKLRLALSPFEPEWANVPLYVTARRPDHLAHSGRPPHN